MNDPQLMAEEPGEGSPSKIATILQHFVNGARLNRFDAERLHDHCLHSTVAALQAHGLVIERQWESVPCLGGSAWTRVKRYWLARATKNLDRARELIKSLRGRS